MDDKGIQQFKYKFRGAEFQGRDSTTTTKDQRLINLYQETVEKFTYQSPSRVVLVKRPGITNNLTVAAGVGRGIWAFNSKIWFVIGSIVYMNGVATGTTLATTTGTVGFTECTSSGSQRLFFCDGTNAYVIDLTNTITQVTDGDFPTPHVPTPVYLDGYVVIPRASSADLYNSDLENPLSWTASNFITAESFSDYCVSLAKQNNQLVALGTESIEFFYDAANATGTPFASNSAALVQMGTCSPYAVSQNEKNCYYIGESQSGGRSVWLLNGFQPAPISTPAIDRVLNNEGTAIATATSYLVRLAGHFFYVLKLSTRTFVYDIDEKVWHEWTTTTATSITVTQIGGPAPLNSPVINGTTNSLSGYNIINFSYNYAADIGNGVVYLLGATNGIVSTFSETTYKDLGQTLYCSYTSPLIDFDTYSRKFLHRMDLITDLSSGGNLYLKWSDDDYATWSNTKTISLTSRPSFTRLGMFRRRAFNLYHIDNTAFRLEGFNFTYTEGTS